tara:strand:+ start:174 stop:383 length:210 start_codon:yes stop_codon:yes gene_type:complete
MTLNFRQSRIDLNENKLKICLKSQKIIALFRLRATGRSAARGAPFIAFERVFYQLGVFSGSHSFTQDSA